MRKKSDKKITKGMPSAVLLSILIHAGLFLLAGMLVVFTVHKVKEPEFEAPKAVDRPKMKLKKPKVKIKKSSKPKSTTRIVTQANRVSMPDIQLPEMSGMGDGLGGGVGDGFDMMPALGDITVFGNLQSIGNDLEGTFYDFNRRRDGHPASGVSPTQVAQKINRFFTDGWRVNAFGNIYAAQQKLYATAIAMPPNMSTVAPEAFGEPDAKPSLWLVHYKGKIVYPEDITFRFWAYADDIVSARVGGEMVVLACFPMWHTEYQDHTAHQWQSSAAETGSYVLGNTKAVVGDWITLKANEPQDIEVLLGENKGGVFGSMLLVEVKGEKYEKNPYTSGPMLPFFKTEEFTLDQKEQIYYMLPEGEATCDGGPVFNDFHNVAGTSNVPFVAAAEKVEVTEEPIPNETPEQSAFRLWKLNDGKEITAEFKVLFGKDVVLANARGKQLKIPIDQLALEDQKHIALLNPPQFNIEFSKSSNQRQLKPATEWIPEYNRNLQIEDFTFGVRLKSSKMAPLYNYPLTIEYFAIGDEVEADNFVLLQRKSETFTPSDENKSNHEFYGDDTVKLQRLSVFTGPLRGVRYGGYLVTVTDVNGNIVQHQATNKFLFEHLENLKKVPLGKHFNKECNRVMPPRPTEDDRASYAQML